MLPQSFYQQSASKLARALLGKELVYGETSGIIVETEAYSQEDAASHSYSGETPRTKAMFGPGGYAYVYFTYGMHYCFNVVSGEAGHGEAVLIRALEPRGDIDEMIRRRGTDDRRKLTNGPAKLVQALGIGMANYGMPLFEGELCIRDGIEVPDANIVFGPRIGISKAVDMPWRFWIADNKFVSRP